MGEGGIFFELTLISKRLLTPGLVCLWIQICHLLTYAHIALYALFWRVITPYLVHFCTSEIVTKQMEHLDLPEYKQMSCHNLTMLQDVDENMMCGFSKLIIN